MICTSIQNRTFSEIIELIESPFVEMAEIRLDLCPLTPDEIKELFSESDIPLVATCRTNAEISPKSALKRLEIAIKAGARFADLEIEAPAEESKHFRELCEQNGTEIIRSYHNFSETPDDEVLQMALARCFRYGADIAKIVTTCRTHEDALRIERLYSIVFEDLPSMQGRLVAFGMGEEGRQTRIECLRRGAPFSYASVDEKSATAPGQLTTREMFNILYSEVKPYHAADLTMPASKSFAQRAIIAAALSSGTSCLKGYSPCGDNEAALEVARALGAKITKKNHGKTLSIEGIGDNVSLPHVINTKESGLLTRLMIPIVAAKNIGGNDIVISGEGTLKNRPLNSAADIMASFGVLLSNDEKRDGKDVFVPLRVKGKLIPGTADISGKGGSQLISGLLMALPMCGKDSKLFVHEPKSIPYMYITLDVLRRFGVRTKSEMEGDAAVLETENWSQCDAVNFEIKGGQKYKSTELELEGDWSAAANFLVAGALFGSVEVKGLDTSSLQADLGITDILVEAGAVVSQLENNTICVRKAPLEAFDADLNNSPDLFPIVSVLAAFCAGESKISGVGRLHSKESDRAEAILQTLTQMGVDAHIEDDSLHVYGESLSARILSGRLLRGGRYSSFHDHRMVMALKVASLATKSPIVIDDEACVGKSFPEFLKMFTPS